MSEPVSTTQDGERRAKATRIALWWTIAGLVVNIIGATTFWVSLPEKLKQSTAMIADHETRLRAQEGRVTAQEVTIARIDERTRAIQDSITNQSNSIKEAVAELRSAMKETKDDLRASQNLR